MSIMKMSESKHNQEGMASIVVTSVILIILALLTIGFAKIMDRGLKQTLNRELATQATYAAESGINDAKAYVNAQLAAGNNNPTTNNKCMTIDASNSPPFVKDGRISGDYNKNPNDNVDKYTCVIISSRPLELKYDINAGSSAVFRVIPYSSSGSLMPISTIFFGWEKKTINSGAPKQLPGANTSTYRLPKEDEFNDKTKCGNDLTCTGMLEVTIYPITSDNSGDKPNQDTLVAQNARTYFLYSNGGNGGVGTQPYTVNGQFINGECNTSHILAPPYNGFEWRYCNSSIKNLPANAVFYYVRVHSIYTDQSVTVQAADTP